MRSLPLMAASLGAAALLAGCGGGGSDGGTTTTHTATFNEATDVVYERSYTDCGSVKLIDLAHRYKVKPQKDKVALAVATYWSGQAHAGDAGVAAGKEGCYDGYKVAGR